MTERKQFIRWCALALLVVASSTSSPARADNPAASFGADTATLSVKAPDSQKPWWQDRFAGSMIDLTSYVGSGSFYTSGYSDPYVASALFIKPNVKLGTKRELSVSARLYLEFEYTKPDNPTGRRTNLNDIWLLLNARNLYTESRSKIRFSGAARAILPTSFESRYSHLVVGLSAGLAANRKFEFGSLDDKGKPWTVVMSLGSTFSKYLQTSKYRGNFPGDTSGCRNEVTGGLGAGIDGSAASTSDRCGGPLNTNYSFTSSLNATLARRRWSLATTLIIINQFQYAAPDDIFLAMNGVTGGRRDATWGLISLGYDFSDRYGASIGLSSYQPALNSQYTNVRFPFFDFSGANANNFTQVFIGLNGTL